MSVNIGDRVRWYVMAVGDEVDLHGVHWHGNTVIQGLNTASSWLGLLTGLG